MLQVYKVPCLSPKHLMQGQLLNATLGHRPQAIKFGQAKKTLPVLWPIHKAPLVAGALHNLHIPPPIIRLGGSALSGQCGVAGKLSILKVTIVISRFLQVCQLLTQPAGSSTASSTPQKQLGTLMLIVKLCMCK